MSLQVGILPRKVLDRSAKLAKVYACLKLLPDLVTVRLYIYIPIKTYREDKRMAPHAAEIADSFFCKLYPSCSRLKALVVTFSLLEDEFDSDEIEDADDEDHGFLRVFQTNVRGQTRAGAEAIRPELIKHYVRPCDVIEDDEMKSGWGWSSR
ncbi:hypothetical protein EJ03DRAFT_352818 [Teratosphaeria nubilosa]|uniref:Uncharacterized protein n=1 Tax=Teratosphaeria nubilosa TaxID=161662 RepID=A0A6G1L4B1_9PEZI|nr:hypothetical protein EJ03DRAFT_352818 [Teratosphaeria nubilosa]